MAVRLAAIHPPVSRKSPRGLSVAELLAIKENVNSGKQRPAIMMSHDGADEAYDCAIERVAATVTLVTLVDHCTLPPPHHPTRNPSLPLADPYSHLQIQPQVPHPRASHPAGQPRTGVYGLAQPGQ